MKRLVSSLAILAAISAPATASATTYFEEEGGNPLGSAGNWTNYLSLADLTGNGQLDLVVPNCGGFFGPPSAQPLRVFINDGGSFSPTELGSAAVRVVAIGDIDNDGALDVYAPSAGGQADKLFINDGSGGLTDEASTRLPGVSSTSAGARFGDVDSDGDLDLLVGSGYNASDSPPAHLYLNDGNGNFEDATAHLPAVGSGSDPDDVDWIDVDRDFDLDVLINVHSGKSMLWINDGSGNFSDATDQLAGMPGGFHYGPSVCDVDGDGDLDIWTDNMGPGYSEQLQINDGNGNFTDETSMRVTGNGGADDNGTMCVDVDSDGDFDLVIPSLSDQERVFFNDGTGKFSADPDDDTFSVANDPTLWIDFGDLDGDGRIDAVTGQGEGNAKRNRVYLGTDANPVDDEAPKIIATEQLESSYGAGAAVPIRFALSDRAVTDVGPRLTRAWAKVTVDGGNTTEVDARFMGGDLFRVVLPAQDSQGASVQVQACATDRQGNEGCGATQTYTIEGTTAVTTSVGVGGGGASSGQGGAAASGAGGADDDGGFTVEDEGCTCTVPGPLRDQPVAPWLVAAAVAGLLLRRRS